MEQQKPAPPMPGADILASLITAVLILTLTPLMLGLVDGTGAVASLIWIVPGFILMLIAIVRMFQEGNALMAAVNAVLTGMALCQVMGRAFIILAFMLAGKEMPPILAKNMDVMSGGGFLVSGIFLLTLAIINLKGGMKLDGICIFLPTLGFILLGLGSFGASALTLPGFVLLDVFGLFMLYKAVSGALMFAKLAAPKPGALDMPSTDSQD